MTRESRILAALEQRARSEGMSVDDLLAELLPTCPTCGQAMPTRGYEPQPPTSAPLVPRPRGRPVGSGGARPGVPKWRQIVTWLRVNPEKSQTECAEFFGVDSSYVSRIVRENSSVRKPSTVSKRQQVIEWMQRNPTKSQADCARAVGTTGQYVYTILRDLRDAAGLPPSPSEPPPPSSDEGEAT